MFVVIFLFLFFCTFDRMENCYWSDLIQWPLHSFNCVIIKYRRNRFPNNVLRARRRLASFSVRLFARTWNRKSLLLWVTFPVRWHVSYSFHRELIRDGIDWWLFEKIKHDARVEQRVSLWVKTLCVNFEKFLRWTVQGLFFYFRVIRKRLNGINNGIWKIEFNIVDRSKFCL